MWNTSKRMNVLPFVIMGIGFRCDLKRIKIFKWPKIEKQSSTIANEIAPGNYLKQLAERTSIREREKERECEWEQWANEWTLNIVTHLGIILNVSNIFHQICMFIVHVSFYCGKHEWSEVAKKTNQSTIFNKCSCANSLCSIS